ncbi:MAG: SdiA-regulated domain-containing protein [Chitinophagaceae bacterium]
MRIFPLVFLVLVLGSCAAKKENLANPPGYNLAAPVVIKLPLELDEISGVTFYPTDTSLFAITDELGLIYKITPGPQTAVNKWKFADPGDYEEVVLIDSVFYVLESGGSIASVKFVESGSAIRKDHLFPYGEKNEFESLYYDSTSKKLVMVCKDCDIDKKKKLSTFTFDPVTNEFSDRSFSINIDELAVRMKTEIFRFKPSAANQHPITGDIYIISAINEILLITDRNGKIKGFYPLDSGIFKQPEGLCFTNTGKMIITNEAADVGTANILIYDFKK